MILQNHGMAVQSRLCSLLSMRRALPCQLIYPNSRRTMSFWQNFREATQRLQQQSGPLTGTVFEYGTSTW